MGNGNVDDHVVWNVIDHDKGIDVRLDSHHIIGKVVELPNISSNIKVIQTQPPFSLKEKKVNLGNIQNLTNVRIMKCNLNVKYH